MDIYGNLRFQPLGGGQFQNFVVERFATFAGFPAASTQGRLAYADDTDLLYYDNGVSWESIGSSGSVDAVQDELDALELALGDFINPDGTFDEAAFAGFSNAGSPATSLYDILEQLDQAITDSSTPPAGSPGQIQFNGGGGNFGADADLSWNSTTNTLTIGGSPSEGVIESATGTDLTLNGAESLVLQSDGVTRLTIENDGSWNVGGSNGTAGQAILSNGDASAPTWQDIVESLDDLSDVTLTGVAPNDFLVYTGAAWENATAAESRTALGLGTMAEESADDYVEIAGDTMTGDLAMSSGVQFLADIGTAAEPGYAFTGSPGLNTTGVFAGNTTSLGDNVNYVGVSVDGVEIGRFERTTMLGSPEARLILSGAGSGILVLDDASTAAVPGLTFLTDEDTGIFHDGANNIGFSTNGIERLQIEANGTLSVAGGSPSLYDYAALVLEDNDIPNKRYVDDAISSFGGTIELNDLTDVNVGSPALANNDFFVYNSGSSMWENQPTAVARASLGLVSGGAGDIWVDTAGDSMTGQLNMTNNRILNVATPIAALDAANKVYVDSVATGLNPKQSVYVATTVEVGSGSPFYNYFGSPQVQQILGVAKVIDGVDIVVGSRVLVKDQVDTTKNGIYEAVSTAGSPATFTLRRTADFDGTPSNEVQAGNFTFVQAGDLYQDSGWVVTATGSPVTELELEVGIDPIVWTQFSGAGQITAGVGLVKTGNTLHVNLGAGIFELPTDEVGIELFDGATGAIILTDDGTTRATTASSRLHLLLANATLTQGASGLAVAATNLAGDTGTGSVSPAGTLTFDGNATQGVSTNATGSTIEITVADATDSTKGVASFVTPDFSVVAGAVSLAELFTIDADTGTPDPIEGGDTLTFVGAAGIDTAVGGNSITITNTDRGSQQTIFKTFTADTGSAVAESNNDTLAIVGGVGIDTAASNVGSPVGDTITITLNATLDNLSDVVITPSGSPASADIGQVLVMSGSGSPQSAGAFVNRHIYAESGLRAANTTHAFTHNLGQQWVTVTVLDNANQVIIPNSITMTDEDTVTVTFGASIETRIVVMGIPSFE